MQASIKKKKSILNQYVMKFTEIGMDIAITNKEDFHVNI